MSEIEIIDMNNNNILKYGNCGYKSIKRAGFPEKIGWMKERFAEDSTRIRYDFKIIDYTSLSQEESMLDLAFKVGVRYWRWIARLSVTIIIGEFTAAAAISMCGLFLDRLIRPRFIRSSNTSLRCQNS